MPVLLWAHPSWGIVVDDEGNIYFTDITHNERGSVWKLTSEGELILLLGDFHAHNVSLDGNGNLITAHGEGTHTMVRLSKTGEMDTLYHTLDHKTFFGGNCAYSNSEGIVFGIEKRFWKIDKDGNRQSVSDHVFEWNQSIYVDDDGNYYGPDIGKGNSSIVKIEASGNAKTIATNLISKQPFDPHSDVLLGITKDDKGTIYVAETAGQRILKIGEDTLVETFYVSEADWFPTGIDFHNGNAFILEFKTKNGRAGPRITKVGASGEVIRIFDYGSYEKNRSKPVGTRHEKNRNGFWLYVVFGSFIFLLLFIWVRVARFKKLRSLHDGNY
ncbi:hypothetical protein POV27_07840 [Aureisphaera galaxeae]|uniref:hypothetical protein n=1 Tax=Aureisphaera galaxeae TaxID=1538023 RepID=UPI002350D649|nr:hypothetical protein [Aureisphaera galaxeae]MDC8003960.1 hypothetical protein [Aureisphaera galaxeae]